MKSTILTNKTKSLIKGYLEGFVQGLIDEKVASNIDPRELRPISDRSTKGTIKPFHQALLPEGILRISEFERSFSTKLGNTFEEVARLLAIDNNRSAERGYRIEAEVSIESINIIEQIKSEINLKRFQGSYLDLVNQVIDNSGSGEVRRAIADLFVLNNEGQELYFEIKSPKPNKGQCLEITERLLTIHSLRKKQYPDVKTYYAMAYNPYGNHRDYYRHSFVRNYMDFKNQILIGKEFWNLIGGDGAYEEVLSIYTIVGKEKGPEMLDQLALGY